MQSPRHLEVIPLGGLGEFGMNLMVYRYGEDCLVVDAGMMFPGADHLGVDVVIPNMEFLDSCGTIHAVILTHGHEDHIGALPYLLARHDVPVYSTPFTLGLVRARFLEHDISHTKPLDPFPADGAPKTFGPFTVEAIPVAHSIPQAVMLVLRTPLGTVVHTADFKMDPCPRDGSATDLRRLARLGEEGVLAAFSDSTNAERPGVTPGERTVGPAIDALLARARGRVFITTFSSHVDRLQHVVELAGRHGRKVALLGSSLLSNAEVAERLDLLRFPAGSRIDGATAMGCPADRVLFIVTGSQGEPLSALARIAVDKHKDVSIEPGDLVIHSARTIPGNEKSLGRMFNHLLRRGAEVVTETDAPVHVSGHPAREELRLLLHLLSPSFLVPIHGEYRQLLSHARLGRESGMDGDRVLLAESGDVIALSDDQCSVVGRVRVGQVFIDSTLEEVDPTVLKDRRRIAGDGIVVAVVALDRERGAVGGTPEIVTRGFVPEASEEGMIEGSRRAVIDALAEATPEERADEGLLKARVHAVLKQFLLRRTERRPLIVPVIVEL